MKPPTKQEAIKAAKVLRRWCEKDDSNCDDCPFVVSGFQAWELESCHLVNAQPLDWKLPGDKKK